MSLKLLTSLSLAACFALGFSFQALASDEEPAPEAPQTAQVEPSSDPGCGFHSVLERVHAGCKALADIDLSGADLSGLDLSDADFARSNLSGANLSGANLSGAYMRVTNLAGADLSDADLTRANLSTADLRGAQLMGADLTGTMLMSATCPDGTTAMPSCCGHLLQNIARAGCPCVPKPDTRRDRNRDPIPGECP